VVLLLLLHCNCFMGKCVCSITLPSCLATKRNMIIVRLHKKGDFFVIEITSDLFSCFFYLHVSLRFECSFSVDRKKIIVGNRLVTLEPRAFTLSDCVLPTQCICLFRVAL
jgi:hypothetical protein